MIENMVNGLDNLMSAIVIQACNDYFTCKRTIEVRGKNSANRISNCEKELQDCIDFFNSAWYRNLVNNNEMLSGDKVMARLDEMAHDLDNFPKDYKPFKYGEDEAEEKSYQKVV